MMAPRVCVISVAWAFLQSSFKLYAEASYVRLDKQGKVDSSHAVEKKWMNKRRGDVHIKKSAANVAMSIGSDADFASERNVQSPEAVNLNLIPYPAVVEHHSDKQPLVLGTRAVRLQAPTDAYAMAHQQLFDNGTKLLNSATAPVTLLLEYADGAETTPANLWRPTQKLQQQQHQIVQESYELLVREESKTVHIRAPSNHGLFNGIMTFLQLLQNHPGHGWIVPNVKIQDAPTFAWRGLMLDVSRHFFNSEKVKVLLNTMKLFKFNHLHLHLTDDQGWRLESETYPKLVSIGAWRKGTQIGHNEYVNDRKPYGGFFTKQDIKDIVAYAKGLYIDVMPEIDLPGHAQAAIAAYPELGNDDVPSWQKPEVATSWGVHDYTLAPKQHVIKFAEDVLDEAMEIMPSEYVHLGGDEVPTRQWDASNSARSFVQKESLGSSAQIQSFFTGQLAKHISEKGRKIVLWDEAFSAGSAPAGSTIMVWTPGNNAGKAREAARAGHDVILAPHDETYFDQTQGYDKTYETIGGNLQIEKVYSLPLDHFGEPAPAGKIIGGQGQLWSEYFKDWPQVEYMAWPRGIALSEVLWTGDQRPGWRDFEHRLGSSLETLKHMGVNFKSYK